MQPRQDSSALSRHSGNICDQCTQGQLYQSNCVAPGQPPESCWSHHTLHLLAPCLGQARLVGSPLYQRVRWGLSCFVKIVSLLLYRLKRVGKLSCETKLSGSYLLNAEAARAERRLMGACKRRVLRKPWLRGERTRQRQRRAGSARACWTSSFSRCRSTRRERSRAIKDRSIKGLNVFEGEEDLVAGSLHDLPADEHFVEEAEDLVEVEDDVQLAHVGEVLVKHLDQKLDELEVGQLAVVDVHAEREEQSGVALVDDLVVAVLQEVGVAGVAHHDDAVDLGLQLELLGVLVVDVPAREPGLALSVLQQDKPDHYTVRWTIQNEKDSRKPSSSRPAANSQSSTNSSSATKAPSSSARPSTPSPTSALSRLCNRLTSGNNITAIGFQKLCMALAGCKELRVLRAEWNFVGSRALGLEALYQLLRGHRCLQKIDLRNNKINDSCAGAIASIVELSLPSLTELDLKWNELTNSGAEKILKALFRNKYLRVLDLYSNRVSSPLLSKFDEVLNRNRNSAPEPARIEALVEASEPVQSMGDIERTIHLRQLLAAETSHFTEVIKKLEQQIVTKKVQLNQKTLSQKDYVLRLQSLNEENMMLKDQIDRVVAQNDQLAADRHRARDYKGEEEREIRKLKERKEQEHAGNVQAFQEKVKYEQRLVEEQKKDETSKQYDRLRFSRQLKEELRDKVLQLAEERLRMKLEFESLHNKAAQAIGQKIRKKHESTFCQGEERLAEEEAGLGNLRRRNEVLVKEITGVIKRTQLANVDFEESLNQLRQEITTKHNEMSKRNLDYEKAGIRLKFIKSRIELTSRDVEFLQNDLRALSSSATASFDDLHDNFRKEKAITGETFNEYHKRVVDLERLIRLQEQTNNKVRAQLEKVCSLVESNAVRTVHATLGKMP